MSAIILHRIYPAKNIRRFTGSTCSPIYSGNGVSFWNGDSTATEAHEALPLQRRVKERRGYRPQSDLAFSSTP